MAKAQVALGEFTITMIEPLPIAFKQRERIYRQLARKGIVALYEVRNLRHYLIGFELILVRYQPAHYRNQWKYPERERYPSAQEFGRYAWSIPTGSLGLAELAFEHLAARMGSNRSESSPNKDFYRLVGRTSQNQFRALCGHLFVTGRRLPKTPHRNDRSKRERRVTASQTKPQSSHNEDSP